jgi:hypothetical protein
MRELGQYLEKYRSLAPPEASIRKVLAQVLHDECGFDLKEKDLALQRGGVIISCHPTIRSEIMRTAPHVLTTLQHSHNIRLAFIR